MKKCLAEWIICKKWMYEYGFLWCDDHPICQIFVVLFFLISNHPRAKWTVRNSINSIPQLLTTTFALSSVWILFYSILILPPFDIPKINYIISRKEIKIQKGFFLISLFILHIFVIFTILYFVNCYLPDIIQTC